MTGRAYYNECDAQKAAWLRELIKAGAIPPGEVDERSIHDVRADDLRGFVQCHFFAGIGVWSYALRLAGWSDDEPVWTGSCPCQSFSAAGKRRGFDDPRHLWPAWWPLIRECRPATVIGEQVAAAVGHGWWDIVSTDLEGEGYAAAAAVLTSAGVGGPDIRERLYWVADARCTRGERRITERPGGHCAENRAGEFDPTGIGSPALRLGDTLSDGRATGLPEPEPEQEGLAGIALDAGHQRAGRAGEPLPGEPGGLANRTGYGCGEERQNRGRLAAGNRAQGIAAGLESGSDDGGLADAEHDGHGRPQVAAALADRDEPGPVLPERDRAASRSPFSHALNGYWRDADWLLCTDGRWRPVRPGSFPLVTGAAARLVRLRGYGDCINVQVAKAFIESYIEARQWKA